MASLVLPLTCQKNGTKAQARNRSIQVQVESPNSIAPFAWRFQAKPGNHRTQVECVSFWWKPFKIVVFLCVSVSNPQNMAYPQQKDKPCWFPSLVVWMGALEFGFEPLAFVEMGNLSLASKQQGSNQPIRGKLTPKSLPHQKPCHLV